MRDLLFASVVGVLSFGCSAQPPGSVGEPIAAPMANPDGAQRSAKFTKSTLAVWVDSNGRASRVELRKSCGARNCDAAAMAVVQTWAFASTTGEAVPRTPRLVVVGVELTEQ